MITNVFHGFQFLRLKNPKLRRKTLREDFEYDYLILFSL